MSAQRDNASTPSKPDRRQELILAAYHTIAQKGFEGLRVRDVAEQVGINGATLHHYFKTKEALIQAVVEYAIGRTVVTTDDLNGTPAEQLHEHLERLYQLMRNEPILFVVLAEMNLRSQRDPELRDLIGQEGIWHDRLVAILRAGIEQQHWPPDLDPVTTASAIISLMEGASLWAVTYPKRAEEALSQLKKWLHIS